MRLGAVPFAIFQVALGGGLPAWLPGSGVDHDRDLHRGRAVLFWLSRREWPKATLKWIGLAALAFDFAIVSAYTLIYSFQPASPIRQVMYPAARRGGAPLRHRGRARGHRRQRSGDGRLRMAALGPVSAAHVPPDYVTLQLGIEVLLGLIVGWLMLRLLGAEHGRRGAGGRGREAARPARPPRRRCSRRPTAAPGRSARRSSSIRPSTPSSARCAGCCRSTGSRSCSARTASRR